MFVGRLPNTGLINSHVSCCELWLSAPCSRQRTSVSRLFIAMKSRGDANIRHRSQDAPSQLSKTNLHHSGKYNSKFDRWCQERKRTLRWYWHTKGGSGAYNKSRGMRYREAIVCNLDCKSDKWFIARYFIRFRDLQMKNHIMRFHLLKRLTTDREKSGE